MFGYRGSPAAVKAPSEGEGIEQMKYLFPLGQTVITPGALSAFEDSKQVPLDYLQRHAGGDWGDLTEEDKSENELSLKSGFRLLSAYRLNSGMKIWVITEADRSVTTILLPEEY
jgi:hypothetical protein